MITNIAKMSNRLTMDRVTTSTRPMPTTKAAKMSNLLMFPPLRAASSTRLPHLPLSCYLSPEYGGKDKKKLGDCLMPMDSRGMCNVEYTLSGQSASGCAVFKTTSMNTTSKTNERR